MVMKKLTVNVLDEFKIYKKIRQYDLEGDLIILSGINGSGKSQLLQIIANDSRKKASRSVLQTMDDGEVVSIEEILLLSFRDNINLGEDFGLYSVTHRNASLAATWNFYKNFIRESGRGYEYLDSRKKQKFNEGALIFDDNGLKNPSWRSIIKFVEILKTKIQKEKIFTLTESEIANILPMDFIWRNENDIVSQVGNLFYIACCNRVDKQIECSKTTEAFDNNEWLKHAPWTILNQLFAELKFKYRFREDYTFHTPYMDENPKLRENSEIRNLNELSDGEKAILKLALISLDEEISKDIKLVLFDEYDAPLNPSLTEAFYHVIEKFYIDKGIQVIITTHSPATISLAPEYAQFYEIFAQDENSPKIVKVNKFDYEELRAVNKRFYDKIKNQGERIQELEQHLHESGKMLFVEDKFDQIYKIAYLKVKNVSDVTEDNFEEKFRQHSNFEIHGNFSCGGLYQRLMSQNFTSEQNSTIICLFDFDQEGFQKFEDLKSKKDNKDKIFSADDSSLREGLTLKHYRANRYALMLPIPERLEKYVSAKSSSDCFIEVETLLSQEYLESNDKARQRSEPLPFFMLKDGHKCDFWKDLLSVDKKYFEDFEPLFNKIEKIFDSVSSSN